MDNLETLPGRLTFSWWVPPRSKQAHLLIEHSSGVGYPLTLCNKEYSQEWRPPTDHGAKPCAMCARRWDFFRDVLEWWADLREGEANDEGPPLN